jgi:hypothetical protein
MAEVLRLSDVHRLDCRDSAAVDRSATGRCGGNGSILYLAKKEVGRMTRPCRDH